MDKHKDLIGSLLASSEFQEAMEAALASRANHALQSMRSAVRTGNSVDAAHQEGQLVAYERLMEALRGFVRS